MRTFLLCMVTLAFTTSVQGQTVQGQTVQGQALQPAPHVQPAPNVQPWETPRERPRERPLEEPAPAARALFHIGGGFGIFTRKNTSSGYPQLETAGYNTPDTSLHLNAGAQLVPTSWLRMGGELSYEFAGDTTEQRIRGETETRTTRFHMGMIDLSLTPYIPVGRFLLGLRFAAGLGFSRWVHNSRALGGGIYRASAAFDVFVPLSRQSSKGLNIRVGYQLRRTLPTGPLDLVFDHSSVFFNFAFMFGASS